MTVQIIKWIDGMLSDNGAPSSSRVLTAILVAFVIGLTIAFTVAVLVPKHLITMTDFTGYLEKAGWFLSANILALYGTNRLGNALDKKFGPPDQ